MEKRPRQPRRWQVKPWLRIRDMNSQYTNIFQQLDEFVEQHGGGDYLGYIRIDQNTFAEVLERIGPRITKSTR